MIRELVTQYAMRHSQKWRISWLEKVLYKKTYVYETQTSPISHQTTGAWLLGIEEVK
jgi:hypothetical protein